MCNIQPCREYATSVGPWGQCHRLSGGVQKCPPYAPFTTLGVQHRNVTCHDGDGRVVADQFCKVRTKILNEPDIIFLGNIRDQIYRKRTVLGIRMEFILYHFIAVGNQSPSEGTKPQTNFIDQ